MAKLPLLIVCGPTASGKTAWALELAKRYPLEIISADSRQVYRQMDIGTAKATPEEQQLVPHYLIDVVDPDGEFSVAEFVDRARPLIEAIHRRQKLPCVVGGTGLYIRALLGGLAPLPSADAELREQLHTREQELGAGTLHRDLETIDPQSAAAIHPSNLVKIVRALEVHRLSGQTMSALQQQHRFSDRPYRTLQIAPAQAREELYRRIDLRAGQMLELGLIEETQRLIENYSADLKALQTLGYREVLDYLAGRSSREQMLVSIQTQTRRYAKRQLTWFRKEPEIIWVDSLTESGRVLQSIDKYLLG